jgi:hypothetical protein
MPGTNEAFSRVKIDAQLKDRGWNVLNPNAVRFEYVLPDKTKAYGSRSTTPASRRSLLPPHDGEG